VDGKKVDGKGRLLHIQIGADLGMVWVAANKSQQNESITVSKNQSKTVSKCEQL